MKTTLPKLPHPQDLAFAFARLLREELSETDMGEVIARNAAETHPNVCHSHDFCDANMVMLAAWQELTGRTMIMLGDREELTAEESAAQDKEIAAWNAAWQIAKESEFETDCATDEERSNGPRR